jgi:hypothetical protein
MNYPLNRDRNLTDDDDAFTLEGVIVFLHDAMDEIFEAYREEQRREYEYRSDSSNWSYPS